jgi:hypothetical protein
MIKEEQEARYEQSNIQSYLRQEPVPLALYALDYNTHTLNATLDTSLHGSANLKYLNI